MPVTEIPNSTTSVVELGMPKVKGLSKRGTKTDVTEASVAVDTHVRPSKEII